MLFRSAAVCCSVFQGVAVRRSLMQHDLSSWILPTHFGVVLQCVVVCCSVLQCAVVCCSVLQCIECVPMHNKSKMLYHTATHCNTPQYTATYCNKMQHTATHCKTLQHTARHCNTPQHTTTHHNTLQHSATLCNTLQHINWFLCQSGPKCGW